jgi:hypothetical protein
MNQEIIREMHAERNDEHKYKTERTSTLTIFYLFDMNNRVIENKVVVLKAIGEKFLVEK